MLIPFLTMAQETPANSFFNKHSGENGYTSVHITQYMFDLFSKISNEKEEKDFKEVTSKLTSIKILTVDSSFYVNSDTKFEKEILSTLPESIYKELMIIREGRETIKFLINEKGKKISEFIMIVYGTPEPVLIFLEGDISLKQISKLSKTMNVKGFEHLDKIHE
jgi:hypothetical protein